MSESVSEGGPPGMCGGREGSNRRWNAKLVVVVPRCKREEVMRSLHEALEDWLINATRKLVMDCF